MAYSNKAIDHEKRKNMEGSYSVYNQMYRYLMKEFEPKMLDNMASVQLESLEKQLAVEGEEYALEGGKKLSKEELIKIARGAITNFINNNGQHGDTAENLGNKQENSLDNIKRSLSDLRW